MFRIRIYAHLGGQCAFDTVERAYFFAGTSAPHDHATPGKQIHVEGVEWMPKLKHYVVRGVNDVVDRCLSHCLETLSQPIRRGSNFHATQHARRVAAA